MIPEEERLEIAVYITRKTSLNLDDISKLRLDKLIAFYNELTFQESQDKWEQNHNMSVILASIYNTMQGRQHTYKESDFYDVQRPTKGTQDKKNMDEVDEIAQREGFILPEE
jgi:hypothetical protein